VVPSRGITPFFFSSKLFAKIFKKWSHFFEAAQEATKREKVRFFDVMALNRSFPPQIDKKIGFPFPKKIASFHSLIIYYYLS
jgi:hypothetical protein